MRTIIANSFAESLQYSLYKSYNHFGKDSPVLSRILALPIAVIDVAIDTLKCYASAIEHVAVAIINLIGVLFSKKYSFKDALVSAEDSLIDSAKASVKSMLATPKIAFQCLAILFSPSKVKSISSCQPTFDNESINIYYVDRPNFSNALAMHAV